jgi:hypothetical protein
MNEQVRIDLNNQRKSDLIKRKTNQINKLAALVNQHSLNDLLSDSFKEDELKELAKSLARVNTATQLLMKQFKHIRKEV